MSIKSLNKLEVSDYIGEIDAAVISKALKENAALVELDMRKGDLSNKSCILIAGSQQENTVLKVLKLTCHRVKTDSGEAVAKMLLSNNTLKKFHFLQSRSTLGGDPILEVLKETHLSSINFSYMLMEDRGAEIVLEAENQAKHQRAEPLALQDKNRITIR